MGIGFGIWGLKCLHDWRSSVARKAAAPEPSQHLSAAQQQVRDGFREDTEQYKLKAIVWLLIATLLIGLYLTRGL